MAVHSVRPAVNAGAGRFYPDDPAQLRQLVQQFANDRQFITPPVMPPAPRDIVALVAPHAGYAFSGPTAGIAFGCVASQTFERIIVMGPSHYARFPGASVCACDAWATPLGEIPADTEFIQYLMDSSPLMHYHEAAEEREHCIEVELPFLQVLLGGPFQLVPVLLADQSYDNAARVSRVIASAMEALRKTTLIVASSDLYHGPNHKFAQTQSHATAAAIQRANPENLAGGFDRGDYMACGAGAILAALMLAARTDAHKGTVLEVTTSYEVNPVRDDYVVGYGAIAINR